MMNTHRILSNLCKLILLKSLLIAFYFIKYNIAVNYFLDLRQIGAPLWHFKLFLRWAIQGLQDPLVFSKQGLSASDLWWCSQTIDLYLGFLFFLLSALFTFILLCSYYKWPWWREYMHSFCFTSPNERDDNSRLQNKTSALPTALLGFIVTKDI